MTASIGPSDGKRDAALPAVQVTTSDYDRLSAVVDAFRLRGRESAVDFLAD